MKQLILGMMLGAALLTGCASHYVITLTNGYRIVAAGTVHVLARTAFAVLGADVLVKAVVDQRVDVAIGYGINTAAAAAVAAVRAAFRDEFFAAKARGAIAALAGDDFDGCFVYEFHDYVIYVGCAACNKARELGGVT